MYLQPSILILNTYFWIFKLTCEIIVFFRAAVLVPRRPSSTSGRPTAHWARSAAPPRRWHRRRGGRWCPSRARPWARTNSTRPSTAARRKWTSRTTWVHRHRRRAAVRWRASGAPAPGAPAVGTAGRRARPRRWTAAVPSAPWRETASSGCCLKKAPRAALGCRPSSSWWPPGASSPPGPLAAAAPTRCTTAWGGAATGTRTCSRPPSLRSRSRQRTTSCRRTWRRATSSRGSTRCACRRDCRRPGRPTRCTPSPSSRRVPARCRSRPLCSSAR